MITTERLLLRPHRRADFEAMAAMFADPVVRRYLAAVPPSPEDTWNRLLRYAGHWTMFGFGMFAVIEQASGRFVGEVGLADFCRGLGPRFDGHPEGAWIFSPDVHGRGYGFEAVSAVHRWFDARRGPARTVCIIRPENTASLRLAEKAGYRVFDRCDYKDATLDMLERLPDVAVT